MRWDVIVVGAGPSGAAVALWLARAGARVVVLERGRRGRDKPCGEGLLPEGVRALERAGLASLLDGAPRFEGIAFRVGGREARGRFRRGMGVGVRRDRLDAALADAAAAAGAELRFGARVRSLAKEDGDRGWEVATADGERLGGAVLVGADGARSWVRRSLGLDGRASERVALVGHVAGAARSWVEMYFEDGFEVALTPVAGGAVSVAALVEPGRVRELARDPAAWLARRLEEVGISGDAPAEVGCLRLGGAARAVSRGRAILVGDAAGAVDPIVGCGIALGLLSAPSAARAILALLDGHGEEAMAHYRWQRRRLAWRPGWAARASLLLARRRRLGAAVAAIAPGRLLDQLVSRLVSAVGGA